VLTPTGGPAAKTANEGFSGRATYERVRGFTGIAAEQRERQAHTPDYRAGAGRYDADRTRNHCIRDLIFPAGAGFETPVAATAAGRQALYRSEPKAHGDNGRHGRSVQAFHSSNSLSKRLEILKHFSTLNA
jgi:hypothetical protein